MTLTHNFLCLVWLYLLRRRGYGRPDTGPSRCPCYIIFVFGENCKRPWKTSGKFFQSFSDFLKKGVDILKNIAIINYALRATAQSEKNKIAGLCKGSTTDSDSVCEGSNPSPAAKRLSAKAEGLFFLPWFCHRDSDPHTNSIQAQLPALAPGVRILLPLP